VKEPVQDPLLAGLVLLSGNRGCGSRYQCERCFQVWAVRLTAVGALVPSTLSQCVFSSMKVCF
jgi:hypothetical protein